MLIWFIEDEEQDRNRFKKILTEEFPDDQIKMFDSAFATFQSTGSPDIIIIDVAGASGTLGIGCSWAGITSPIKSIVEKHPSANYGFFSAIDIYAKDIVEDFKEDIPEMVAEFIDSWEIDNFVNFIKKWK